MTALIRCERVTVIHGRGEASVAALSEVDFKVEAGERVALLGRSGSGKTTLLHLLAGLLPPLRGTVRWRGERLLTLEERAGRAASAEIGMVFQGSNLLPSFTSFENVAFAASDGVDPTELLGLVGLAGKLDALPGELSGGERQRVAIARALAVRPQMLLCDEPTGHLDRGTGLRVLDLFDALHLEFRFAQVTATHDPGVAARADRVVHLEDGRVHEAEAAL